MSALPEPSEPHTLSLSISYYRCVSKGGTKILPTANIRECLAREFGSLDGTVVPDGPPENEYQAWCSLMRSTGETWSTHIISHILPDIGDTSRPVEDKEIEEATLNGGALVLAMASSIHEASQSLFPVARDKLQHDNNSPEQAVLASLTKYMCTDLFNHCDGRLRDLLGRIEDAEVTRGNTSSTAPDCADLTTVKLRNTLMLFINRQQRLLVSELDLELETRKRLLLETMTRLHELNWMKAGHRIDEIDAGKSKQALEIKNDWAELRKQAASVDTQGDIHQHLQGKVDKTRTALQHSCTELSVDLQQLLKLPWDNITNPTSFENAVSRLQQSSDEGARPTQASSHIQLPEGVLASSIGARNRLDRKTRGTGQSNQTLADRFRSLRAPTGEASTSGTLNAGAVENEQTEDA